MKTHKHRCGLSRDALGEIFPFVCFMHMIEDLPIVGCGHVFEHGNDKAGDDAAHMCPNCGKGPWTFKHDT